MSDAENIETRVGRICEEWWRELQGISLEQEEAAPSEEETQAKRPADPDRASLARLRRIGLDDHADPPRVDLAQARMIAPFRRLLSRLERLRPDNGALSRYFNSEQFSEYAVVAASTLARIREDTGRKERVARLLGDGDKPAMAEARFKRLIRTRGPAELLDHGRRIAALLGGKASVADLGTSLLLWDAGPGVIRRWTVDYYKGFDETADESLDAPFESAGVPA